MTQVHVEPPSIPQIEGKYDGKSDKYFVKVNFSGYPMSSTSDLYEFMTFVLTIAIRNSFFVRA